MQTASWVLFTVSLALCSFSARSRKLLAFHRDGPRNITGYEESIDLDYRSHWGKVKDQQNCGICWAYAANAVLEAAVFKLTAGKVKTPLSEQLLLDCISKAACSGSGTMSYPETAFRYYDSISIRGLPTLQSYPYKAEKRDCHTPKFIKYSINERDCIVNPSEEELKQLLLEKGPVASRLYSSPSFIAFKGKGVYRGNDCLPNVYNHVVVVAGYGTSATGEPFWLLRNSHGSSFGDAGYMRILRGQNICGIESKVWWATTKSLTPEYDDDLDESLFVS